MKTHSLVTFTRGAVLGAIVCGCGADPSDDAEPYGATTTELNAWADSLFMQTLRVDPGSATTVRNRCEMILRLPSVKPLTFTASQSTPFGPATEVSVGWTGSPVSSSGLSVSACISPGPVGFCNVTATWLGNTTNGSEVACQIIADDGQTRIVGDSSGNSIFVPAAPSSSVMFKQHVQTGNSGTERTGTCILRKNGNLPTAEVTGFSVSLNGSPEVSGLNASLAGAWPTNVPGVDFGRISVGTDSDATRLRHIASRQEQLAEGDALRCAGSFSQSSIISAFSVNMGPTPTGDGMSITTEPTAWTCTAPKAFGAGNGCDCDCGVQDPVCGPLDCTHITVTAPSFAFTINGVAPNPPINLVRGRTYVFDVNTGIHPFAIHMQSGNISPANRYLTGVTGNQGLTLGQLQFAPPLAAPSPLHYQCESHIGMTGPINFTNP